jgi:hypothetical protein
MKRYTATRPNRKATNPAHITNGTTNSPTTIANRNALPGNFTQANAYAAKAARVIGMTVAGMVTIRLLMKASNIPPRPSTWM